MKFCAVLSLLVIPHFNLGAVEGCSYRKPAPRPEEIVEEPTTVATTTTMEPVPLVSAHEARLDFVKFKLLESLGLSRPPSIHPDQSLSENVLDTIPPLAQIAPQSHLSMQSDEMQRSMVMTFGDVGASDSCHNVEDAQMKLPSISFKLPVSASTIARANVWYYMPEDDDDFSETTVTPTEFCSCSQKNGQSSALPNCMRMDVTVESHTGKKIGWKSFSLGFYVQSVASDRDKITAVFSGKGLGVHGSKRPFLVVELNNKTASRNKRSTKSVECALQNEKGRDVDDVDQNKDKDHEEKDPCCCRASFYVTVEELGWSNWIKFPKGFNFYHCVGTCPNGVDRYSEIGSPDHSLFVDLMYRTMNFGHRPCCVARETSPMPIVFFQDNATINRTVASKFIVQDCGCFGTM